MMIDEEDQSDKAIKKSTVLGDHGELWIKLKLPKDEEGVFVEKGQNQLPSSTNNDAARICHVCNKGFRSGKALGGHMRIHFQAHKQKDPILNKKLKSSQPIKLKKRKREEEDGGGEEEEATLADIAKKISISKTKSFSHENPTCSLCLKTFPSMKSLFGHMRCHPDREWRGIQPPPRTAVKTSSNSSLPSDVEPQYSDDQVKSVVPHEDQDAPVDYLTKLLPKWSATAKRGRKKTILDDSSEEDEEFLDAANELIRLAHGGCSFEYEDKKHVSDSKNGSFDEFSAGISFSNERKFVGNSKEYEEEGWSDDESGSKNSNQLNQKICSNYKGKGIMVTNKKKRKKIKDLESVHEASPVHPAMTATPDKYRCTTCNKSFPTHQALGGHRSSHHKIRVISNQNSMDEWTSATDEEEDENLENSDPILEEDEDIKKNEMAASSKQEVDDTYQCKICSRKFLTGKALGGHKKCHSAGAKTGATLSSQETSSGDQVSHTCGTAGAGSGRVMEFDLNEAPPMEDDAGFGHAFSSFNSVDQFPVFESSSSRL